MQENPLVPDLVDLPSPAFPQIHPKSATQFPDSKNRDDASSSSFQAPWNSGAESINGDEDKFCSVGLQELPVFINSDLTLNLLQAPTAFRGVQHDETGTVVWGASVCLARYLSPNLAQHRTVLELGCGCGLPSLVAANYGASRVIASDMEDGTLQQLDQVARLNAIHSETLELIKLNWKDDHSDVEKVDLILASDVIYHEQMVVPLVKTIDAFLSTKGKAYLSLRTTRQGVSSFWQDAMPAAGFQLVESISCRDFLSENDPSKTPLGLDNEATSHRFRGDHVIYVFQRQKE